MLAWSWVVATLIQYQPLYVVRRYFSIAFVLCRLRV